MKKIKFGKHFDASIVELYFQNGSAKISVLPLQGQSQAVRDDADGQGLHAGG